MQSTFGLSTSHVAYTARVYDQHGCTLSTCIGIERSTHAHCTHTRDAKAFLETISVTHYTCTRDAKAVLETISVTSILLSRVWSRI
eukprot:scaffold330555_cov53-Tisochrysis_lutea.AAC.1